MSNENICSICSNPLQDIEDDICNECYIVSGDVVTICKQEELEPVEKNKTPQFCIITPTAYLEKYASQSSMHLVLAHLVDHDHEYEQFYAQRNEFKIMDNGAFELGESYEPDSLVYLGEACQADAIVLPDYPFQSSEKTIFESRKLIYTIKDAGFKTMFVPQSETGNIEDWIKGYEWGSKHDGIDIIGMSILGIPNALSHIPAAYARVVMTQLLIDRGIFNFNKYHHYLGLNSGPALEVPPLIKMNAMDSMDSSGPVWAGICGTMYTEMADSYQPVRKISKHVEFEYSMTKDEWVHTAIQHNIDLTLKLFEGEKNG